MHMPARYQRPEVPQEERTEQCCDVLTVRVRIRKDADLVIAQRRKTLRSRIHTERNRDVMHFSGRGDLPRLKLPGVQDLAAQRHDGLEVFLARLLRRSACGVTFHQKQLRARGITRRTVRKLAWQRGA